MMIFWRQARLRRLDAWHASASAALSSERRRLEALRAGGEDPGQAELYILKLVMMIGQISRDRQALVTRDPVLATDAARSWRSLMLLARRRHVPASA